MKLCLAFLFMLYVAAVGASNVLQTNPDTTISTFNKDYAYEVKKVRSEIRVDGVIEEPDWQAAQKADTFLKVLPIDSGYATQLSTILMTYDDKALYLAQIFYDTIPGKRVMESFRRDFAFDAKIGISSSMNLDLTYNPDFAQVEVDRQIANIDRFELFFPEKRQVFLSPI
ncbi:MAG: DUF5916 domain-containing protein [Draconibacterium sp.]